MNKDSLYRTEKKGRHPKKWIICFLTKLKVLHFEILWNEKQAKNGGNFEIDISNKEHVFRIQRSPTTH